MPPIRIIIADDHEVVRIGLKQVLSFESDMTVVAEVDSGIALLEVLAQTAVDLAIIDLSMPGIAGIALIQRLRAEYPDLHLIMLSIHHQVQLANEMLEAGADGYVGKAAPIGRLLEAIHVVQAGQKYMDPELGISPFAPVAVPATSDEAANQLSSREFEVLRLIAAGHSLREIAETLFISPKTVSTHKTRIMNKLGLTSNADLLRFSFLLQP